ncbi:MAG: (Fe-S)-binding protein [Chloroflexota bacterium]
MSFRLDELRDDLRRCNKCGSCAAACPSFRELRRETASARGRVNLVEAFLDDQIGDTKHLSDLLYLCLGCHSCVPACPNGVRVDRLVMAARAALVEADGHAAWRNVVFDSLLPHPRRLDLALWPLRLAGAAGLQPLAARLPGRLGDLGSALPKAPLRSASAGLPALTPAQGERRGRVAYFLGCAQNLLYPEAAQATVAVLSAAGYEVALSADLRCCGLPALVYGEAEAARELARSNVAALEALGAEAVVTDCASCGSFLKEYGELLADDGPWGERASQLAASVRDVSEFLVANPPQLIGGPGAPLKITYHDPCHLAQAQGIKKQPRTLLRAVPGLELVETRTPGACCGSAGSYALTHPEVSQAILRRRVDELVATGAEIVATGCPACRMQIEAGLRRAGSSMRVRHTTELLATVYVAARSSS